MLTLHLHSCGEGPNPGSTKTLSLLHSTVPFKLETPIKLKSLPELLLGFYFRLLVSFLDQRRNSASLDYKGWALPIDHVWRVCPVWFSHLCDSEISSLLKKEAGDGFNVVRLERPGVRRGCGLHAHHCCSLRDRKHSPLKPFGFIFDFCPL